MSKARRKIKKIISALFSALLVFTSVKTSFAETSNATDFDPNASSKNVFQMVNEKAGSSDNLQKNLISPLLGQGDMYNLEGSKSFKAQISCPSSTKFLEIIMQPQSSGDVNFFIYYDKNLDGNIDSSLYVSNVSGLCSDGFISCQLGTWNDCKFYKFSFPDDVLTYNEVSFYDVSGCFCINNYCGNGLAFRNAKYLLSVFGGVVVSVMQEAHPQLAVSKVQTDQLLIKYYGQDSQKCSVVKDYSQGFENPVYFYDNPYDLQSMGQSQLQSCPFTQLFQSHLENTIERRCTIRRIINEVKYDFTQVLTSSSSPQCPGYTTAEVCGENCLKFQMPIYISAGGAYTSYLTLDANPEMIAKLSSGKIRWCTNTTGPFPCTDDDGWYRFYLNGVLFASGGYGDCEPCWHTVNFPVDKVVEGTNTFQITIGGAGGGEGVQRGCRLIWVYLYFNSPLKGCYIADNYVEDNCQELRQKASTGECTLKDRTQNGVVTIKDYHSTGLIPLMECHTICENVFCYDDWTIEETYECKVDLPTYDMTRPQQILQSMNYSGSNLQFTDVRQENGTWVSYPNQGLVLTLQQGEACPKVCKVKVIEQEEDVGQAGAEGRYNMQKINVRYDFRECKNDVCPYDPSKGEEVVADCACLTDFNEALVSLQSLRMVGKDIICSSGQERSF